MECKPILNGTPGVLTETRPSCSLLRVLSKTAPPKPNVNPLALSKAGAINIDVCYPPTRVVCSRHFSPLLPPTPLSFSQSSLHSFSPGANVYISCNRLLHGAPEFILQPVVMACFLDESWQHVLVDS